MHTTRGDATDRDPLVICISNACDVCVQNFEAARYPTIPRNPSHPTRGARSWDSHNRKDRRSGRRISTPSADGQLRIQGTGRKRIPFSSPVLDTWASGKYSFPTRYQIYSMGALVAVLLAFCSTSNSSVASRCRFLKGGNRHLFCSLAHSFLWHIPP